MFGLNLIFHTWSIWVYNIQILYRFRNECKRSGCETDWSSEKNGTCCKDKPPFLVGSLSMWNIRREDWRRLTNPLQGGGAIPWDGEQLFSSTFGFYGWDMLKMEVPGRFVRFISDIILCISDKGKSTRKCAKVVWYVWKRWMNNQLRFTNCFTWLHLVCLRKALYLKTLFASCRLVGRSWNVVFALEASEITDMRNKSSVLLLWGIEAQETRVLRRFEVEVLTVLCLSLSFGMI